MGSTFSGSFEGEVGDVSAGVWVVSTDVTGRTGRSENKGKQLEAN